MHDRAEKRGFTWCICTQVGIPLLGLTAPWGKPTGVLLTKRSLRPYIILRLWDTGINLSGSELLLLGIPLNTLAANFCLAARTDSQSPLNIVKLYFYSTIHYFDLVELNPFD